MVLMVCNHYDMMLNMLNMIVSNAFRQIFMMNSKHGKVQTFHLKFPFYHDLKDFYA